VSPIGYIHYQDLQSSIVRIAGGADRASYFDNKGSRERITVLLAGKLNAAIKNTWLRLVGYLIALAKARLDAPM
jgi:hypothetical protein